MGGRNLLLYFEHEDIEAAFENIAPHVEVIHPIERQAWGQRVFRFFDPDRHAVEIGDRKVYFQAATKNPDVATRLAPKRLLVRAFRPGLRA